MIEQPTAAPAPEEEPFQATREAFRKAPGGLGQGLLFLGSLTLFVLVSLGGNSPRGVALLVAALLFHELGHYLGMRAFDYADVKMFFIPFFGAAVSGRRREASAWKEAVVLLLGPGPGLLLGAALAVSGLAARNSLAHQVAALLLGVNAINLLPFYPLDGGRLFRLLLFARNRHLEAAAQALGALALMAGGLWLKAYGLIFVGYLMFFGLKLEHRLASAAARLKAQGLALPTDSAALDDDQLRALYRAAYLDDPPIALPSPKARADSLRLLHERLELVPPPWAQTAGLGALWALAAGAALAGSLALGWVSAPLAWTPHTLRGGFVVDLPGEPQVEGPLKIGQEHQLTTYAVEHPGRSFVVTVIERMGPDAAPFNASQLAALTEERQHHLETTAGVRLVSSGSERIGGMEGQTLRFESRSRQVQLRVVGVGNRAFIQLALERRLDGDAERFMASLRPE